MGEGETKMAETIYNVLNAAQERFAYFFLAAAGGSIAFAIAHVQGESVRVWMAWTGLAVAAWAVSFFFGSHYLLHRTSALLLNFQRQKIVEGGEGRLAGQPPAVVGAAIAKIDANAKAHRPHLSRTGKGQFWLFFVGAVAYVVGEVIRLFTTC